MNHETLTLDVLGTKHELNMHQYHGIVAGYTARDSRAVEEHITELSNIGVAPPPEVPMFYPVPATLFSAANSHQLNTGALTSGEVEPAYIRHNGRFYLGVGSDHTDRDLETKDIGESKVSCPKPIGRTVIPIDDLADFPLDGYVARCWVDGTLYQEGTLSGLRAPLDIIQRLLSRTMIGKEDFICLGGTLPLIDGKFQSGAHWRITIDTPAGQNIDHTYTINSPSIRDG